MSPEIDEHSPEVQMALMMHHNPPYAAQNPSDGMWIP
jgi:hypothetical protein